MFPLRGRAIIVLAVLLAGLDPLSAQEKSPVGASPRRPHSAVPPTFSPLHAFLGIDSNTGEFIPPNPARRGKPPVTGAAAEANSPNAPSDHDSPPAEATLGEFNVEDVRSAVASAIESGDDEALASALLQVPQIGGYHRLTVLGAEFARWGCLILLVPLAMVFAELYSAWASRKSGVCSEQDRRFYAGQWRRSILLTIVATSAIALFWRAGENNFWWDQPAKSIPVVVAIGLLFLAAVVLRLINRRAAARHSYTIIEDLRRQQGALQCEIEDLRNRVQRFQVADALERHSYPSS